MPSCRTTSASPAGKRSRVTSAGPPAQYSSLQLALTSPVSSANRSRVSVRSAGLPGLDTDLTDGPSAAVVVTLTYGPVMVSP